MIDNYYFAHILRVLLLLCKELVAQSVEHLTFNQVVAGSIPAELTNFISKTIFAAGIKEPAPYIEVHMRVYFILREIGWAF